MRGTWADRNCRGSARTMWERGMKRRRPMKNASRPPSLTAVNWTSSDSLSSLVTWCSCAPPPPRPPLFFWVWARDQTLKTPALLRQPHPSAAGRGTRTHLAWPSIHRELHERQHAVPRLLGDAPLRSTHQGWPCPGARGWAGLPPPGRLGSTAFRGPPAGPTPGAPSRCTPSRPEPAVSAHAPQLFHIVSKHSSG